jgi:TatD DNase family protein
LIDSHCHLEQPDYDNDREEVITRAKKKLKAVITSCARPDNLDLTLRMTEQNKGFVFACAALHPAYIKNFTQRQIDDYFESIARSRDRIVAIGEAGLDYSWVKEEEWRQKQKELFIRFIELAKDYDKPLTVHSRDSYADVVRILEQHDARKVHLHLFGANQLVNQVVDHGWYISVGPIVLSSKKHFQISRDTPLEFLLLETDAPWNAPEIFTEHRKVRNEPTSIEMVARKISEIKKASYEEVWKTCGDNAMKFFGLKLD